MKRFASDDKQMITFLRHEKCYPLLENGNPNYNCCSNPGLTLEGKSRSEDIRGLLILFC
jgi:hypothetical protein